MTDQTKDLLNELKSSLTKCQQFSSETPLVNAYQQLSYGLLNRLKENKLQQSDFVGLIDLLTARSLQSRAKRGREYLKETNPETNRESLLSKFRGLAQNGNLPFEKFRNTIEREIVGIVITAHPTFGFGDSQYEMLAQLLEQNSADHKFDEIMKTCQARPDQNLSLNYEFIQSQNALANLQNAIRDVYDIVLDVAQEFYPNQWRDLNLRLVSAASWVGFDVDGRVDITWKDSIKFRYIMATKQTDAYLSQWDDIWKDTPEAPEAVEEIKSALTILDSRLKDDLERLPEDGKDIDEVRAFSTHMANDREKLYKIPGHVTEKLDQLIAGTQDTDLQKQLIIFRSIFNGFGAGVSHIHFRLNAVQLHNAIRPMVALEKDPDEPSNRRRFVKAVSKVLDHTETTVAGYENIMHEQTTAKRLFMITAQILRYIDPHTPIRFLIAESDTPFTVLAALCYARLFGVDDRVDISPLFETDEALERGARIIEELLENKHYYEYVKKRGRLCIQAGYSDAGRYLGQVAAGLGIERLRIKMTRLWEKFDLEGVELVIFDTGGESLGRGAHPEGFNGRLDYKHSHEARRQIIQNNIRYKQEFSLQGGDGYLWLQTPDLAFATVTRVLENMLIVPSDEPDPFYQDTDWSLDFFLTAKDYNSRIAQDPDYIKLLSLLGTDISYPSGSRMTLRREEGVLNRGLEKLSQIRAIPNNMLLHQLGFLANSVGGIGTALDQDADGFWNMYEQSPRLRHIMKLAFGAMKLTDEDLLGAYMAMFRPRYWMHCARYEEDSHDHQRMLRLAKMLEKHGAYESFNRIELKLREDLMYLRDGLKQREIETAGYQLSDDERADYLILHILRMTLTQKIFLLITRIPRFRDRKGISVDDLMMQILQFHVPAALGILRQIFPTEASYTTDPENPEKATFTSDNAHGYEYENRRIFDEIESCYDQIRRISLAISAYVGAIG